MSLPTFDEACRAAGFDPEKIRKLLSTPIAPSGLAQCSERVKSRTPFIVLEGLDACGKDTIGETLAEDLNAALFRFPDGNTPAGHIVRRHLAGDWCVARKTPDGQGIAGPGDIAGSSYLDAAVFQLLQTANRLEHAESIRKNLEAGRPVVSVRYLASGICYGAVDGLDRDWLIRLQLPLPQPTLTIFLDVTYEAARERLKKRTTLDRYEKLGRDHFNAVRFEYQRLFGAPGQLGGRWWTVDATDPMDTVYANVIETVRRAP